MATPWDRPIEPEWQIFGPRKPAKRAPSRIKPATEPEAKKPAPPRRVAKRRGR